MKNLLFEELEEQMSNRIEADDAVFDASLREMNQALFGKRYSLNTVFDGDVDGAGDAISAIMRYYGIDETPVPETIKDLGAGLDYLIRPYGFMWRNIELTEGWENRCVGAMLGYLKDGTPIALLPRRNHSYYIFDNDTGRRIKLTKKMAQDISCDAICFYRPFPNKAMNFKDLCLFILGSLDRSDRLNVCILAFLATLVGLIPAYANEALFNNVVGVDAKLIPMVLAMLVGASISAAMLNVAKALMNEKVLVKIQVAAEAAAMARILSLPIKFFRTMNSGAMASRIQDISQLCVKIGELVFITGISTVISLIYIRQIATIASVMVLPSLCVLILSVLFSTLATLAFIKCQKQIMKAEAESLGTGYAILSGIQKIKFACAEKRGFAKWASAYAREVSYKYNIPWYAKLNSALVLAISLVGTMVMYYYAAMVGLSAAQYISFNIAFGMVSGAFVSLAEATEDLASIKPVYEMTKPILEAVPETGRKKEMVESLSGSIELDNISFRYSPTQPYVLNNLSLKIKRGQYVAIVGKTGCGKSTLVNLLLGFEEPERGCVFYDRREIKTLDVESMRSHIGVVAQEDRLFAGTIYENVVACNPMLSVEEAWDALEKACMADEVSGMPMGIHTMISEDSGSVSGGQRQRLAIARAIAPKPQILIFDEATSALDNTAQKKISRALDSLDCTRIVVAHRLSTIRQCDRIIVLNNGSIAEDGTYDELMKNNGFFTRLVGRQRLDV